MLEAKIAPRGRVGGTNDLSPIREWAGKRPYTRTFVHKRPACLVTKYLDNQPQKPYKYSANDESRHKLTSFL